MGRLLGIDYGTKRCGIAVSDPLKMISSGLTTVASHELMKFLIEYMEKEVVECIVVGKPMQADNRVSELFIHAERFVQSLKKRFPEMRIEWQDERYTSKLAVDAMVRGGMKKKNRMQKGNIDKISAALILQAFMEEKNNNE